MTEIKAVEFIQSKYDKENCLSTVTVRSGNNFYTAHAKANGTDIDHASEFKGCTIAELKANKKALKAQLNELKRDYDVIHQFVEKCKQSKNFDENSPVAKLMFRQENIAEKKVNLIQMGIITIENMLERY